MVDWSYPVIDTLLLDIETTDLNASCGVVLCGCYMSSRNSGEVVTLRNDDIARAQWKRGIRGDDRELVKTLNAVIRDHDVVVAHYGKFFDLPFLRTRALIHGLAPLHEMKVIDPWAVARRHFRFGRNRLDTISKALKSKHRKTPLDMEVWASAKLNGDRESMDLIVEHCVEDVHVLWEVLQAVKPFVRQLDDRGSGL